MSEEENPSQPDEDSPEDVEPLLDGQPIFNSDDPDEGDEGEERGDDRHG